MAAGRWPGCGRAGVVGMTVTAPDLIAGYLAELYAGLRVPADEADLILAEAEDHLRETAAVGLAAGMTGLEAQRAAISSFGPVRAVLRAHRRRAVRASEERAAADAAELARPPGAAAPRRSPARHPRHRALRRPDPGTACPAVSSSAPPSPRRWRTSRRCCWPTSPPASWTPRPPGTCSPPCRPPTPSSVPRCWWSPTTRPCRRKFAGQSRSGTARPAARRYGRRPPTSRARPHCTHASTRRWTARAGFSSRAR